LATDPALRRNVALLGADYALYLIGLSFASQSTILPAFAAHLGASNVIIGAIPALMTLGWLLPPLFAAHHTRRLAQKLPFVLRYTGLERAPFLIIAVLAFAADRAPTLALAGLLAMLLVITGTGGVLMPAWMDVVARAIPARMRGRFFGVASSVAGVGGLLGSFGVAYVLAAVHPPASYGVCFLATTVLMGLSWIALGMVREPESAPAAVAVPLRGFVTLVADIVASDRNLLWFLVARACMSIANMSSGFFTVYALRQLGAKDWQVGIFTSAFLAGQVAANAGFGWLADRVGHRAVLIAGTAAATAANAMALATSSVELFALTFALSGINQAAYNVSSSTMLLEFSHDPDERATYIGIGNTALAPFAFGAPLLAGAMADRLGLPAVFAVGLAIGVLGAVLFTLKVREPRTMATLPLPSGERAG
jgi:MFS family permease